MQPFRQGMSKKHRCHPKTARRVGKKRIFLSLMEENVKKHRYLFLFFLPVLTKNAGAGSYNGSMQKT